MREIHCCHYTRQVGVVSYLVRAIEGIIRMCLIGNHKTGRDPQIQPGSDLLIAQPFGDQLEDFALAR